MKDESTARALESCFVSESTSESRSAANVVDMLDRLSSQVGSVARAITPSDAMPGKDASGGHVESLTEAVMGLSAGASQIARAIESLADAVRDLKGDK